METKLSLQNEQFGDPEFQMHLEMVMTFFASLLQQTVHLRPYGRRTNEMHNL